ncbi:SDR family oxidoreductase [Lentzea flava]|uniref:Short chain dehydrogenase n=1 Tax=Lentzea flava TaxID=103732 RepID=A0ABQ2UCV6_9PSEU|nr:SDR family oxidoreductase [Lentzea flava]MCP2196418.1 NAD(P)-dependent dehydrogenase, short-chain alcohol dehydrogenase family [Lentzea flava]GGU17949.1 short chain dehydrogenase [Lentzea flava]
MELSLDGSVVLVTGGVRGVGLGITRAFLSVGATVVTCARRPASVPGASFVQCDVRDAEQVSALVSGIVARFGRLDVLVNNAGGAPFALADKASPRFHQKVVELNLLAPLLVSQAANAVMQESGGSIVMVSSISGRRPSPGTAAYGAAKAGLDSLTSSLAVEWAPRVRVNALAVGMVRTEQSHLHYGDEAGIEAVSRTVPLGRLASPDEVGACAVFLASPLASYVTGSTLVVHGGGEVPAFLAAANTDGGSS